MKVGILALQGAVGAHRRHLERLGAATTEVRVPDDVCGIDAIVMPGGESTTMTRLIDTSGLRSVLSEALVAGMPVLATCAGMILLAREVLDGRPDQWSFGVLGVTVRRNAYGSQIASFEADLEIPVLGPPPFRGVFIRAPVVEAVEPEVEVLATYEGRPVLCRRGPTVAASFHPELTDDPRIHSLFLELIERGGS
ncbi:MAG: pyridoxal 5'-phosphate synthase subunit PdxT [Acidimicrobiales bacterium]|nr:MAG: pyridoxal 5'-phosphate synthase subunit PdxT [Acidimicrobiales bacterium]